MTQAPRTPGPTLPAQREPAASRLSLTGLTVERGRRTVVRDVTFEIPAAEVTALLGPNGAGKSSLVLAVGGVLRARSGAVLLGGRDLARHRPEHRHQDRRRLVRRRALPQEPVLEPGRRTHSPAADKPSDSPPSNGTCNTSRIHRPPRNRRSARSRYWWAGSSTPPPRPDPWNRALSGKSASPADSPSSRLLRPSTFAW